MNTIKCKVCDKIVAVESFKINGRPGIKRIDKDGHTVSKTKCYQCFLKRQRVIRKKTNNTVCKKYEKTPNGFLMRLYRNMLSRTKGIVKPHLYKGLEILTKEDFYKWAQKSNAFWNLFLEWEKSNYDRKLTPSIDRKDSTKGYSLKNCRWVTHSENSKYGNMSKHKQRKITEKSWEKRIRKNNVLEQCTT